ncbi:hypothetical protein Tco_0133439 [Tanacetum coccineum]
MSSLEFAETHNLVAFLEKLEESNGFEEIIDFLNTSSVQYALTVNPTIYTTCIEQFWTSVKAKTVNEERTYCLPTTTIFIELERIGAKTTAWNEFSSTMASAIICLATNQKINFSKYIFDNMMKSLEGGVKFLMYPRRKHRKDSGLTEPIPDEATNKEHVATPSCDPPQSGKDRMQLTELMDLCTQLQSRVLALETTKSNQALEIESLKRREDVSKQGRKIVDLDADAEVTLVDETREMNDDNLMFDTCLTLAQTLIEIKAAKPKAVTSAATTTTTTRPKARGVVVQDPSEFKITSSPLQAS